MILIRFFLLVCFLFLLSFQGISQAYASCPIIHPTLNFEVTMHPVTYDDTLDKAQIRVKSNATGLVSGHVQGHVNVEFIPKTRRTKGSECIIFSHADIIVTTTPILRIAKNYPKGSCEYKVVKAHEEKHLKLMNAFFKTLPQKYKSYLVDKLKGKGSVALGDKTQLKKQLLVIAQDFVTRINRDQKMLHDKEIDAPQKIIAEQVLCSHW